MNIRLIPADRTNFRRIKEIYLEAFPEDERAPFWLLKLRYYQDRADFWAVSAENSIVGFAYIVRHRDLVNLFFFATDKSARGNGYGTQIMEALKRKYEKKRLVLALEAQDESAENYQQRVKRRAFYIRSGLKDLPYYFEDSSGLYSIMSFGGDVKPEEYEAMIYTWLGPVLKHLIKLKFRDEENQD